MKLCTVIFFLMFFACSVHAQITDKRKFELDSLVSVMPVETKKNLWKAHDIMDKYAVNDEEKVWVFYGYIGSNFKYDMDRFREKRSPEYSPELTAQKGKAVCRDFARLFAALCERSNIKCLDITGRADVSFLAKVISYFRLNFHPGLHAWNLVQFNSSWHLMDPTWTFIEKTEKIKVYSEKTRTWSILRIKRCSRTFYDPDPEFMAKTHAPNHPAFFMLSAVPTYKSAFKRKQKNYLSAYNFESSLDSIFSVEFPGFSPVLTKGSKLYSKRDFIYYRYLYEISIPLLRPSRFQPATVKKYDDAEARINRMSNYISENHHISFRMLNEDFKKKIDKKRNVLKKLEEKKSKSKKASKNL